MFESYNKIYLQKETNFKRIGRSYSLTHERKLIGTVKETATSAKNIGNVILEVLPINKLVSLELQILDSSENILGTIRKEKGFHNEFQVFSETNQPVATIQPTIKVREPKITVLDENGDKIMEALGGYGGIDFTVTNSKTEEEIGTVNRRSLLYSTVKETLTNDDGYYIEYKDNSIAPTLIAIGIVIDFHMFER